MTTVNPRTVSASDLRPLRALRSPREKDSAAATNRDFERVAESIGRFLCARQVHAEDISVPLTSDGDDRFSASVRLDAGLPGWLPKDFRFRVEADRERDSRVWCYNGRQRIGPFAQGEFLRLTATGKLEGIPGFTGVQRRVNHPSAADLDNEKSIGGFGRSLAKRLIKRVPGLLAAARSVRQRMFPEPPTDMARIGGVTWRIAEVNLVDRFLRLQPYDRGGIFDQFLNAEGLSYPPQVPGNYYADAYSAQLFLWLYARTADANWISPARESIAFLNRCYPQYQPASIVWHHSDFKNPAILEIHAMSESLPGQDWVQETGGMVGRLVEDWYEPTNVLALRYHWKSALNRIAPDGFDQTGSELKQIVERLRSEQTEDGLFHDNIEAYPDAHDLTYHQYSLACLAQGLAWQSSDGAADECEVEGFKRSQGGSAVNSAGPEVTDRFNSATDAAEMFGKGIAFSLALTTPAGEVAYVGRAANNIHHSASAILAFASAANLETEEPALAGQYRRAAHLAFGRLSKYQQTDGMLPTCLNHLSNRRVAWNHCETPYNALTGCFLMKAAALLKPSSEDHSPLPMEQPGFHIVADDAGYAAIRTRRCYAVLFGGCAKSYPWSEGRHITGAAGIAQLGFESGEGLLPILNESAPFSVPITDLPVINEELPYGRGKLSKIASPLPGIRYSHRYGDTEVDRLYLFGDDVVYVCTRLACISTNRPATIRGGAALAIRRDPGWNHDFQPGWLVSSGPAGTVRVDVQLSGTGKRVRPRVSRTVTNPRGLAARVDLDRQWQLRADTPRWCVHTIRCGPPDTLVDPPVVQVDAHADGVSIRESDRMMRITLEGS